MRNAEPVAVSEHAHDVVHLAVKIGIPAFAEMTTRDAGIRRQCLTVLYCGMRGSPRSHHTPIVSLA
jgi:hypothetical protein